MYMYVNVYAPNIGDTYINALHQSFNNFWRHVEQQGAAQYYISIAMNDSNNPLSGMQYQRLSRRPYQYSPPLEEEP